MDNKEITIKESQEIVDKWIKDIGVKYFSELTCLAVLMEEIGEVARIMSRKYGDQSFKQGEHEELADEIADVIFALICIANTTGIDLTEAFRKNMGKKTNRDKNRHKDNSKLQE